MKKNIDLPKEKVSLKQSKEVNADRKRSAAVFTPYLDVMGGGERHILSILKILEEEGYEAHIIWDNDLSSQIKDKLHIEFSNLKTLPNVLKHENTILKKISFLRQFDIFLYVTDGGYFFSSAKKNFIFCMVPLKPLYKATLVKKLKWLNYKFISNSRFTQKKLEDWGIKSEVIYPFIDNDFINIDTQKVNKEQIILTVGRFFKHLHSKRQDIAIQKYKSFIEKNTELRKYKLILAGGLKEEDKAYYEELKELADNNKNIIFKPNISYSELLDIYKRAEIYWHFAGYEIDDNVHPEQVEHLGITPLEAMAAGCITFCYRAGGPKETIHNGENGYLFSSDKELFDNTMKVINNAEKKQQIMNKGKKFVQQHFSYDVFKKRIKEIIVG